MENTYHIIIIFLLIVVIWLLIDRKEDQIENFEAGDINTEALRSIASIYNDQNLTVSNLTVTKSLNILPRGTVVAYTGTSAPSGWAVCDGKMLTGFDGTRFRAPDLRSRFILGAGSGPGLTKRTYGDLGGREKVKLTTDQLPSHNHGIINAYAWPNSHTSPCRYIVGKSCQSGTGRSASATSATGKGESHDNMPPYYALLYIVKL
jgi:microcystin-dependent protein